MKTGGRVTIVQPVDDRLREGMNVRVEGGGENARVLPRWACGGSAERQPGPMRSQARSNMRAALLVPG